jgi:hypothetical protein
MFKRLDLHDERCVEFVITENHLKLLKRMNVDWSADEFGVPSIDPKRPYGDSSVIRSLAEILGIESLRSDDFILTEAQENDLLQLHEEMITVLQICLCTLSFEAGRYIKRDEYTYNSWVKAD